MLVENKEKRVLGPSVPQKYGMIFLKPGINNVADGVWKEARKTEFVQSRLGDVLIEIGESPADDSLAALAPLKALEIVKKTLDLKLLQKWKGEEKRRKVAEALGRQIAIIEAGRKAPQGDPQEEG